MRETVWIFVDFNPEPISDFVNVAFYVYANLFF